jgi:hypothetical protein
MIAWSIAGAALVGAAAAALAWLLRASGWRHSWIAAGACVGVFFGPLCAARIMPGFHDAFIDGAAEQRKEIFRSQRAAEAMAVAASATQTAPADTVVAELDAWRRSAEIHLQERRSAFDYGAMWVASMGAAAITMARSPMAGRHRWWRHGGPAIGAWSVVIPVAAVFLVSKWETQDALSTWSLAAAAIVAFGAALPRGVERWVTMGLLESNAEALDAARGAAGFISLAIACTAVWGMEFDAAAAWLLPWGTMVAAWGLRDLPTPFLSRCAGPATAAVVAIALARIDPVESFHLPTTVGLYFAGEDLRWIAAAVGFALTLGLPWLRSLRVALPIASSPLPQAALASTTLLIGVLPAWIGLSLVAAAAATEILAPMRQVTARHLDELLRARPR